MNLYEYISLALRGAPEVRQRHREALASNPGILTGLAALSRRTPFEEGQEESPIFLFSAGWRAGSTLLQRLIMSDPGVLIWGEPFDECGIVQALASTIRAFRHDWPPDDYFLQERTLDKLPGEWVANLFPSLADFQHGHRALFDAMFSRPARDAGARRWGIKEVRLGSEHALYLRWLYPRARFLFLYRNPLKAYASYKRYGCSWYKTWPDDPVFSPKAFGEHWRILLGGFLKDAKALDALLLSYESLAAECGVLEQLEDHLSVRIDRSIIEKKVGSSERRGESAWVSQFEKWLLRRAVSPLAEQLGYKF